MPEAAKDVIRTEDYREEMEALLENYGFGPANLEFTDGFPDEPLRASKCQKIARKIYFKRLIGSAEKEAALTELRLFAGETGELEDDWMFVKHTLLKHIYSIQHRWQPDHECAKWAFYHLKRV
ncbi:MAG: hypothetical protein H3C68_02465 [Deltaproteobacteria bacterium]|nr:hypothetical protein [Deltaproteobacteria bacterium]MBZ0218879.1 hypothetical protein [Deltaproteobacteria bacterium]